MTLPEWGTFLSGVIAPIAFFWLMVGYFQQAEDLRLNTRALRLQQKELKNQVFETAELVRHTAKQAEASGQMLEIERSNLARAQEAAKRRAKLLLKSLGGGGGFPGPYFEFVNHGGQAQRLGAAVIDGDRASISPEDFLPTGGHGKISAPTVAGFPFFVLVEYTDEFGDREKVVLECETPGGFMQLETEDP